MISTAMLMKIGADQTSARPVSTDRGATDGISFAQSFDEGVGGTVETLEYGPAGHTVTAMQSSKEELPVKIADELFSAFPEIKGKMIAVGVRPGHTDVARGSIGRKIVRQQKLPTLGAQAKNMAGDVGIKDVQSPADAEWAAEGSSGVPQDPKDRSFKNDAFFSQMNADGQLLSPGSEEEIVTQKRAAKTASTSETVPIEKNAKGSAGKVAPMELQNTTTAQHPVAMAAGPALSTVVQGSDHSRMGHTTEVLMVPTVATSALPKSEPGNTQDGKLGGVSVAGKGFLIETIATKDSLVQKDVSGRNLPGADVETASSVVIDQVESTKRGVGVEKSPPTAMLASGGSGNWSESTSGFAITVTHAMAGNAAFVSDMTAPGNMPGNVAVTKLMPGETGNHIADTRGFREQDSSGRAGGSLDNLPQMLTSTPTALEVGIQNGTHGWLKVRAEMTDTGAVNASVSSSSSIGQEMLHKELPSLTAYLQSEKVAVNTVVVHATSVEPRGSAATMDTGNGGQAQHGGDDGRRDHTGVTEMALDGADEAANYESLNVIDGNGTPPLATYVGGGSWLSIRA